MSALHNGPPHAGVRALYPAPELTLSRTRLAVVDLDGGGDGIAYVARLLDRALREIGTRAPIVELAPSTPGHVTVIERLAFLTRLFTWQLAGKGHWVFNHVGIARAQLKVPTAIRQPYAVILCGIEAWDPALSGDRKRVLAEATARIAISDFTANRVRAVHPDVGPITVCPLALLPEELHATELLDRALLASINEHTVAIVGRMSASERYKGHDELLECWPRVLQAVPTAKLLVIGRGDDWQRLKDKAVSLGVANHVLFPGFVPDATLQDLLRRVALFAMPSRGEGFGLVYLEAMRAGLPCIGSTIDAAGDLILDGTTGYLADPDDHEVLAGRIVGLLASRELRHRLGAAARARFEAHFTFERFAARLQETLIQSFSDSYRT